MNKDLIISELKASIASLDKEIEELDDMIMQDSHCDNLMDEWYIDLGILELPERETDFSEVKQAIQELNKIKKYIENFHLHGSSIWIIEQEILEIRRLILKQRLDRLEK